MLSASILSGCSKQSQPSGKDDAKAFSQLSDKGISMDQTKPSDEDIIKAIDDSGIMKRADGSFTVVPPVTVVQKGKQNKDGSWPVQVKFTLTYKLKDGRTSPPTQTTTSFRILRAKNNEGKAVWQAQLGS
jgi:hypothetical protein